MIRIIIFTFFLITTILVFINTNCRESIQENKQDNVEGWEILSQDLTGSTMPTGYVVYFFDGNNGIATNQLNIKKTVNGGKTWENLYSFDQVITQTHVFTTDNVEFIVGSDPDLNNKMKPVVLSSKNRGVSWEPLYFSAETSESINKTFSTFYDIGYVSPEKIWIAGDGGILKVIIDSNKLKVTDQFTTKEVYGLSFDDNGDVWATGKEGYVYQFQNGWNKKQINKNYTFLKVKLIENVIWLLGYKINPETKNISGVLLRSRDSGNSWEDKTPENIRVLNDIYLEKEKGWLVGSEGSIFHTSDNGNSWNLKESPTKNNLLSIFFYDSKNGWISGDNGTVLKYNN